MIVVVGLTDGVMVVRRGVGARKQNPRLFRVKLGGDLGAGGEIGFYVVERMGPHH